MATKLLTLQTSVCEHGDSNATNQKRPHAMIHTTCNMCAHAWALFLLAASEGVAAMCG